MAQFEIAYHEVTRRKCSSVKDLGDPSCPLWFMLFSFIVKLSHYLAFVLLASNLALS
jgi:hypothetical protein